MTSIMNTNRIWIVMKYENFENFEGGYGSDNEYKLPDKAFTRLEDAINYILNQEPVVNPCWRLVGESLDHDTDCAIERGFEYEAIHNGKTYCKEIWYDIIPEELIINAES